MMNDWISSTMKERTWWLNHKWRSLLSVPMDQVDPDRTSQHWAWSIMYRWSASKSTETEHEWDPQGGILFICLSDRFHFDVFTPLITMDLHDLPSLTAHWIWETFVTIPHLIHCEHHLMFFFLFAGLPQSWLKPHSQDWIRCSNVQHDLVEQCHWETVDVRSTRPLNPFHSDSESVIMMTQTYHSMNDDHWAEQIHRLV